MTIIISDTHLTDRFDRRKFTLLERIITEADHVVINGDFWDGYLTTFDRFVTSGWTQLFPLLRERKTVYLYGNHDAQIWADERVDRFSTKQVDEYRIPVGQRELVIQHGHRVIPHVDSWIPKFVTRSPLAWLSVWGELVPISMFGMQVMELYRYENEASRQWAATHLKSNEILVTGHSHAAVFDPDHQYICTGFIRYGHATYLKIVDDQLELVRTRY